MVQPDINTLNDRLHRCDFNQRMCDNASLHRRLDLFYKARL